MSASMFSQRALQLGTRRRKSSDTLLPPRAELQITDLYLLQLRQPQPSTAQRLPLRSQPVNISPYGKLQSSRPPDDPGVPRAPPAHETLLNRYQIPFPHDTQKKQKRHTNTTLSRPATTEAVSQQTGASILAAQRRNRPVSPHLSIYRPQVTWIGSSLNRITGVALSGTMYLFAISYLAAPVFGWHLESASIAASFAALPIVAKLGLKMFASLPFVYHSLNGVRHLVWDTGASLTNKQVIVTGWTVVGLTVATSLGLAFL